MFFHRNTVSESECCTSHLRTLWLNEDSPPPTFYVAGDAPNGLKRMANSARPADERSPTNDREQPETAPPQVKLGFSQILSVQQLDATGHGTTVFKRPDGSIGVM